MKLRLALPLTIVLAVVWGAVRHSPAGPQLESSNAPSDQQETNDQEPAEGADDEGGDPVLLYTGNFDYTATDLFIKGRGLEFTFTRYYRSGSSIRSPMGRKWDHNWNKRIVIEYAGGYVPKPPANLPPWAPVGARGTVGKTNPQNPQSESTESGIPIPIVGAFYYDGTLRIDRFDHEGQGRWGGPDGYF